MLILAFEHDQSDPILTLCQPLMDLLDISNLPLREAVVMGAQSRSVVGEASHPEVDQEIVVHVPGSDQVHAAVVAEASLGSVVISISILTYLPG